MGKVISTHTLSTTWRTSTTAYFLYQNGDSTYFKGELSGYVSSLSSQITLIQNDISSLGAAMSTWINVAYSSNWVDMGAVYPPTSYKKDTLGYVHLRIGCKSGSSVPICTLPAGYRPSHQLEYICYSIPVSTNAPLIEITVAGEVNIYYYTNTAVAMGEVVFTPST